MQTSLRLAKNFADKNLSDSNTLAISFCALGFGPVFAQNRLCYSLRDADVRLPLLGVENRSATPSTRKQHIRLRGKKQHVRAAGIL